MIQDKTIAIIHPGNPRYDFRLKKTVDILSRAGAHVVVFAYISRPENDIKDWNCQSACTSRPFTMFKASENKVWLLRVLWNLTVLNVQLFCERKVDVCEGLAKRALKINPDLVYCIGVESVEEALNVIKTSHVPVVYEAYEYFPALLKGDIYFDSHEKNKKFQKLEKELLKKSRVKSIVVGEEIAEGYVENYGVARPSVVHNAAPTKVESIKSHEGPLRFYFQSYLRPTYNIENLILAFSKLPIDATLTIQGNAHEDGYFESLAAYIESLEIGDRVFLKHSCPYDQVVEEASRYDVGLITLTAQGSKGFNESIYLALQNKLFTYASAGLAIVAADYPAQSRLINSYNCGLVYKPDSIESLIEVMRFCASHSDDVVQMRNNSLQLASDYSISKVGEQLVATCDEAIQEGVNIG